jgi:hypothetical protein
MIESNKSRSTLTPYKNGDYVKVEVVNEETGESEWLWVQVDYCDEAAGIVFGRLDSIPVANIDLKLGQDLAVSFANVKAHKKDSDFH